MQEAIKQGISIVISWAETVWKSIPEEIKPGISIGTVIALVIILIKLFFPKKH